MSAEIAAIRASRDAAIEEQLRAVVRLAEVSAERDRLAAELHRALRAEAERDRLLAAAVAQADAAYALDQTGQPKVDLREVARAVSAYGLARETLEALARELRGGAR